MKSEPDAVRQETAIIIGGGPAGLTAAYELATRCNIRPVVFEADDHLGGISRTVSYKGNRIDIGGHRFYSKSERIMSWWRNILPLQGPSNSNNDGIEIGDRNHRSLLRPDPSGPDPAKNDDVMLIRPRVSRILFRGHLFEYPIRPSLKTFRQLGMRCTFSILFSYLRSRLAPIVPERSLEDFFINRFGQTLYDIFFREYTEKVWGVPCAEISPEWGAQRIKGLSITAVLKHALRTLRPDRKHASANALETSLIEQFLYPKFGPGQLWERVADLIERNNGEIRMRTRVTAICRSSDGRIESVTVKDRAGRERRVTADWFISTMPVSDLINCVTPPVPSTLREVADGLVYRDFLTVGLLLRRLSLAGGVDARELQCRLSDNWIYIQEPGVKVGRLQIFNNWSPYMVHNQGHIWIGLEYFVNEGDRLWTLPEEEMICFAIKELEDIGVISRNDVLDHTLVRMPKAYPAYFGTYHSFSSLREYLDGIGNLFPVGRNGMHRYNNQDHSMLTAMTAVDNILTGRLDKSNIWAVNTENDYHENR